VSLRLALTKKDAYGGRLTHTKCRSDDAILLTLNFHEDSTIIIQIKILNTIFNRAFIYSTVKGD